jgi:hypothetical protein
LREALSKTFSTHLARAVKTIEIIFSGMILLQKFREQARE